MSSQWPLLVLGIVIIAGSAFGIVLSERITHVQRPDAGPWYRLTQGRVISFFVVAIALGLVLIGAAFSK